VFAPTIGFALAAPAPVEAPDAAKIPIPTAAHPATTDPPTTAPAMAPGETPPWSRGLQTAPQVPQALRVFGTTAIAHPLTGEQMA